MFRPPVPAMLEMQAGRPARVAFQGLRGEVLPLPVRGAHRGEWWRENGWQQDEWDLEIHFHASSGSRCDAARRGAGPDGGLYRFYYDSLRGSWFVRGAYD